MRTEIVNEMGMRQIKISDIYIENEVTEENRLSDYDYNMIHYAKIPGLMCLTKRTINGETYFTISIHTYISMTEKLENSLLNKEEIRNFFLQLLSVYEKMQECLLSGDMLCLEPENIYYDCENQKYMFMPLVNEKKNINEGLEKVLTYFIEKCDLNSQDILEMLFEVFGFLNDEKWDAVTIMNYIIWYKYDVKKIMDENIEEKEQTIYFDDNENDEKLNIESSKMKYSLGISMCLLIGAFVLTYVISYQFRYSIIGLVFSLAAVIIIGIHMFNVIKNK